jgi:hypothetical protein
MYNGGKEGVKTQLTTLIAKIEQAKETQKKNDDEREKRQEKRDAKMNRVLTLISVIIALIALIFGVPPMVESLKKLVNGEIHYPKFFHHSETRQEYHVLMDPPQNVTNQPHVQ